MEPGFEFRRDLEQLVHNNVLRSNCHAQRSRFRPGVLVSSDPADIHLQQRTKKKLARVLRSLREDYGVSLAQSKEALAYTNSLEDALNFLALQYTSEELPPTLHALPKEVLSRNGMDKNDGELLAEVNVNKKENEFDQADTKKSEMLPSCSQNPTGLNKIEDTTQNARSWTQQYMLDMAKKEEEILCAENEISCESRELQELVERYNAVIAALHCLQDRKMKKRGDKLEICKLKQEIQERECQLLALGWKKSKQQDDKTVRRNETIVADKEDYSSETLTSDSELMSLAFDLTCDDAKDDETEEKSEKTVRETQAVNFTIDTLKSNEDNNGDDDGIFGLLEQAEATVVSAQEISKSAAIDPAALIAAQAIANLPDLKKTKRGKNKKGRNVLKLQAAAAQTQMEATTATWTGKSPRDHIEQYCQKNGFNKPQFQKLARPVNETHLYSVTFGDKTGDVYTCNVRDAEDVAHGFDSISKAKDAVATSALFELASNLPLYRVLPPVYREMWQKWIKEQQEADAAVVAADDNAQDKLLTEILYALPPEIAEKRALLEPAVTLTPLKKKTEAALCDWNVDDWDADLSDDDSRVKDTVTISKAIVSFNDLQVEEESEKDRDNALKLSNQLRQVLEKRMRSSAHRSKLPQRDSLPIASFKQQIIEMLEDHDVILISGETGCGKSTQVPQFLLENMLLSAHGGARGQIICTQPRRLAAISLAERVSDELGEANMGTGDSLIGFQIRLESRLSRLTRLLFCTTGILLRKLQDTRTLDEEVSHVIVDEVHERDLQSDVLLAMLRQFLAERNAARRRKFGGTLPPLKVILMSATLSAASFQQYFGGSAVCPMVEVPGRTFPVEQFYLEDVLERTHFVVDEESPAYVGDEQSPSYKHSTQVTISGRGGTSYTQQVSWTSTLGSSVTSKISEQELLAETYSESTRRALRRLDPSVVNYELIQALLEYVTIETDMLSLSSCQSSASVLIFLPGLQEITTLLNLLDGSRLLSHDPHGRDFELLPLHSSLSADEQQRIFKRRAGVIRIIAATNIAETSLTIDDVKVVIDTGRVKQMSHDAQHRTNVLDEIWIARANAKQRAGRAGRTSGGMCFRLFPESIFNSVMLEQPIPEIRRAPLTSLCLQIKTLSSNGQQKDGCRDFLRMCLDPPDDKSIQDALDELFEIGALNREDEGVTELGSHLVQLPVDVKVGKLLLLGALFGVFDAASTCAAILETKSPFVAPFGRQNDMKQMRQTFAVGASDLLTDVNAFEAWRYVVQHGKKDRVNEKSFCQQHFLSSRGLRELSKLKRQFQGVVAQLGFLPSVSTECERMNRQQLAIMSAILYAGLAPNLVHAEPSLAYGSKRPIFREQNHGIVVMHPSSINYKVVSFSASNFLTYAVKLHTSQIYLPASSLVLPLAVCLFCRTFELLPQLRRKDKNGYETIGLRVDDWVVIHSSFRSAVLMQELRLMLGECIASNFRTPPYARNVKAETIEEKNKIFDVLSILFLAEYEENDLKQELSGNLGKTIAKLQF
ncbi:putative DNA helicase, ATP-dependent, RecQ type, Helicase-associated domain-containing protein [Plasmopara halstedii]